MAKAKGKNDGGGVNRHLRARLEYLYSAAQYLQSASTKQDTQKAANNGPKLGISGPQVESNSTVEGESTHDTDAQSTAGPIPQLSRVFISHMRGVSLKSQLRLPIDQKRSFCKRCDTPLIPGASCIQEIRNDSRGSRKPWADVRIVRCATCGTEKRFPQTEKRSKRLSERRKDENKIQPEEKLGAT